MAVQHIGVIGGGAWGTALAQTAAEAGRKVTLWARNPDVVDAVTNAQENPLYLPGVKLDPRIDATATLADAAKTDAVLLVVPAQHLRTVLADLAPHLPDGTPLVICAKGIEQTSRKLMSEVVGEIAPGAPQAVLSGPTFAIEVARGLPAAVTLACADEALGEALVAAIGRPTFRPYLTADVTGAEIGGAVKNVLAIACGIVDGHKLGDNARAALIARGLAEMLRLGQAKGGRPETLMGLSGLGDLVLTCTSETSRNYSLGIELGRGRKLDDVLGERRTVAEGVWTAAAVTALAQELGVEMPIAEAVNDVLHGGADVDAAIAALLNRPFTTETG